MMLRMASAKPWFVAITVAAFSTISAQRLALAGDVIVVTSTIQAAVDAAQPGDTIVVPPGTYHESVLVNKNDITITGSRAAVIDAAGFRTGIRVGTRRISRGDPLACPLLTVENFTLDGLTIKNAAFAGIFLIGVDGYRLTGSCYLDNPVYGPFPVCSQNGLIAFNAVEGGDTREAR
jgi:pectin methylesterase-like acyl-CoA thioesterase